MKRLLTALAVLCCCLGLLCGCAQAGNPFAPERYLEVDGQEVPGPTWRDVEKAVEGLNGGEDSYVYLELGQPLDGVWYLSAALPLTEYEDGVTLKSCGNMQRFSNDVSAIYGKKVEKQ